MSAALESDASDTEEDGAGLQPRVGKRIDINTLSSQHFMSYMVTGAERLTRGAQRE